MGLAAGMIGEPTYLQEVTCAFDYHVTERGFEVVGGQAALTPHKRNWCDAATSERFDDRR
ncbi:MAG: hypothetical protein QOC92_96 [Acidimicrobiaceae bacterium]|jgi:hypothetical protein